MGPSFHEELKKVALGGVASTLPPSDPIPPEVIEQALRNFDEKATVEEIQRMRESGGFALTDFYDDLERLTRSGE